MSFFYTKRFLPLFLTQFLGAINDNLLKNAIIILATYSVTKNSEDAAGLAAVAGGLFILPFFLFSATAGQFADKYDRAKLSQIIKIVEIGIMVFAGIGFITHHITFLLFVLFAMGTHSTFFGPIKYALLPQHLKENELLRGNAYIEAGTFLAILLGTILGGVLIILPQGEIMVSALLIIAAIFGYFTSRAIPQSPAPEPEMVINRNIWQETLQIIRFARKDRRVFLCILGISWFWLAGATLLQEFAPYAKGTLNAESTVVTLFLTVFSLGIGIGSILCNRLLKGSIQSTFVPLGALGISVFAGDLYFASGHYQAGDTLMTLNEFIAQAKSWRILVDLFMIALSGGIFIVPLYAMIQHLSEARQLARIIAANNVINAIFMVISAIATVIMVKCGFTIPGIFLSVAVGNLVVTIYICKLLPDTLFRFLARAVLGALYRVEVKGMEHYAKAGDRVLIVANHTSFLDAALIATYMPEKITFAINTHIARLRWLKPLLGLVDTFAIDPLNPLATKAFIELLKTNRKCMIFPEGRITVTGSLMKIYEGPGMIADKSGALLLPVRIEGAQYTPFSRLKGKVRIRWFPKITLTILPPHNFSLDNDLKGRKRRQRASSELYDIMSDMIFESSDYQQTLFHSLLTAKAIHGRGHVVAEDTERKPVTYQEVITRCFVLRRLLKPILAEESTVGVILPTSLATMVTFFALHASGKVPAMLNFTAGIKQIKDACHIATVKTVLTSRRFIALGKLEAVINELEAAGLRIIYLEDIRKTLKTMDKIAGFLAAAFPALAYRTKTLPTSPAVILFTSGSEGTPKGVVLSHININTNRFQLASRIDFGPKDKVFNCLPMFHSFGLTAGTLLPLLSGVQAFYYPSPLHYRIVPELIYDTNATILFGTDTFLAGYARFASSYDFYSIRYIFAGAEKLKNATRRVYADKYGLRIFEGYGATETSPVISINTAMQNRPDTVGRFLPAIRSRLEAVEGITEGGQLFVNAPNVMLGYLRSEKPGELQPVEQGWYDTGDIVTLDAEGYITIQGRTKRFAKIAGEMVSLTAVETAISQLWAGYNHAVVSIADDKKGEQIVLLTDYENADKEAIITYFRAQKINELALPRKIIVQAVPLLGTGKIDYVTAKQIAVK